MSVLEIKVTTDRPAADLVTQLQTVGNPHTVINKVAEYVTRSGSGGFGAESASVPRSINIQVADNKAKASATVTFTGTGAASDTIIINGVTFTAVASGATGNQWNVGGSATISATNLAAAINASVTALVSGYVTATSLAGVVTVTSAFYGPAGNQTTIAEGVDSGNAMAVSSARLVGGAADASALNLVF